MSRMLSWSEGNTTVGVLVTPDLAYEMRQEKL